MKFYQFLAVAVFFYLCAFNSASARIAWTYELFLDENTNSVSLASCVKKDQSGVLIITKTEPKGTFVTGKGDCTLWEVGVGGDVVRQTLLKDEDLNPIQTSAIAVRPGCAMASDSLGNLLTAGVLSEKRLESSLSVIKIKSESIAEPNILPSTRFESHFIKKMVPLVNDEFALVGHRKTDGLYLRIDDGKIIRKIQFDRGRNEIFSGIAEMKQENLSVAIAGSSFEKSGGVADNFLLIYDPNDILIHEEYFKGELTEMQAGFPSTCVLGNGNLVTIYSDKGDKDSKTGLWARCYTQELKLVWEKKLFEPDKSSFMLDMTSYGSNGFGVAILTPVEGLKFYSFDENANKVGFAEYKGMVMMSGFALMRMKDRYIAVFTEGGPGNINELTIKAKVVAFD